MSVKLYMAMSANGMIAGNDDSTDFVTSAEWASYSAVVRAAGNLIVGRRTYEVMKARGEFADLGGVRVVVVASGSVELIEDCHVVADSPNRALQLITDGSDVIVAGGGKLNASFMVENLVDEIYLDIEPTMFLNGVPLLSDQEFQAQLELIDQKMLGPSEIQLHYRVVKNNAL